MMKNKPDIRFDGFTDAWEQRRLGELGSVAMNKRIFKEETSEDGDIPFFKIGTFGGNPDSYISRKKFEEYKSKYSYPEIGDLLLSVSGSIGRIVEYKGEEAYYQDSNIVWLKHDKRLINSFLKQFYSVVKWSGLEGSTIKRLYNKNILETEIKLPTIEEQYQIGTFFQSLDNLITLHQRELENYKLLKKGFLQKLFPSNGDTNPSIRFDGFNDAWEQCNLGEVSDKVTKKNSKNEFIETFTNSAEHGIINQRDFFDKDISNEKNLNGYYVVNENDFVYNPRISNFAPVGPIKRNKLGRTGVMSPLYYVFKTKNVNKTYLEYYFDTTIWHKFMKLNGDSGARSDRFAIKDSVFKEMPIPYPSEGEQHQIGIFFQSLDNLITLHQRELDNYKELKKGFLQKMFV
ncbi:restriction endonuclease subunit S [Erysipelothrix rhusiopathiae]|nr:restriction endonuclease subunit S [Erysipelothrix rhusiopathiae]